VSRYLKKVKVQRRLLSVDALRESSRRIGYQSSDTTELDDISSLFPPTSTKPVEVEVETNHGPGSGRRKPQRNAGHHAATRLPKKHAKSHPTSARSKNVSDSFQGSGGDTHSVTSSISVLDDDRAPLDDEAQKLLQKAEGNYSLHCLPLPPHTCTQTQTQTDTHTHTHTHTQTDRQTDRQTDTRTHTQTRTHTRTHTGFDDSDTHLPAYTDNYFYPAVVEAQLKCWLHKKKNQLASGENRTHPVSRLLYTYSPTTHTYTHSPTIFC
jgi:hypothetical protein